MDVRKGIGKIAVVGGLAALLSAAACVGAEYYNVTEIQPDGVYAGKFQDSGAWKWELTKARGAFTVNPNSNTVIVSRFDSGVTAYSSCSQPYATQIREKPGGPILERSANPDLAEGIDKVLATLFDKVGIKADCGLRQVEG